jgi:hypothetical protein
MFYPSYPINGSRKNHIKFKVLPLQLFNLHGFVLLCGNYSFQYKCQNLIKHTSKITIGKMNKHLLEIDHIHWCKTSHLFILLFQYVFTCCQSQFLFSCSTTDVTHSNHFGRPFSFNTPTWPTFEVCFPRM